MIKWTSITFAAIVVVKILAFLQRGYLAFGEELVAVAWVWLVYLMLHSEWFKSVKPHLKNKKMPVSVGAEHKRAN